MNFFTANPIDKLFSLLSLSHFTEFYYDDNSVMQRERLFVLQDLQNAQKNKPAPKFMPISVKTRTGVSM